MKVKHKLTGRKPGSNKTGADVCGGSDLDPTGSHPGLEPHLVTGGGHNQEGSGGNTDEGQVIPTIQLPQPDEPSSVPTRGGANNQERREADVDGGGVEQRYSHVHQADVEVAEGSEPAEGKDADGEKVERVDPSPPTAFILHSDKPGGGITGVWTGRLNRLGKRIK